MKLPFGTLSGGLVKAISQYAPKYTRIVEPFGDGGTYALELAKRKPKTHTVNVVDETLFAALTTVQRLTSGERRQLKQRDWVASQEAFDAVLAITATEGVDFLYRYLYLKKLGMKGPEPDAPPTFDVMSTGDNVSDVLMGLPVMKSALKSVTITNDDPMATMRAASGAFLILLPKSPEDADAVENALGSLGGPFLFARKVGDAMEIIDKAKASPDLHVAAHKVSSIMMADYALMTNYDGRLVPLDPAMFEMSA